MKLLLVLCLSASCFIASAQPWPSKPVRIPGAELVMVEGAGHLVNLEQPIRFNRIVLDFLTLHRE